MKRPYEKSLLQKPRLRSLSLQCVRDDKEMKTTRSRHPGTAPQRCYGAGGHTSSCCGDQSRKVTSPFSEPQTIKSLRSLHSQEFRTGEN